MRRGWSAPSGSSASGSVRRAEAQHVGDGDRAVGDAEHVADHAADAGVGAAERLDGRRVVVRLGLEGDRRARGELDDAGIADECRAHERGSERLGAVAQLGEQRPHGGRPVGTLGVDAGAEGLVGAVLAPRLGEHLDLDVGDVAVEALVLVAQHPQLLEIEVQRARLVERRQPLVVEAAEGEHLGRGRRRRGVDERRLDRAGGPALDHRVGDQPAHQLVGLGGRDPGVELDAPAGGSGGDG